MVVAVSQIIYRRKRLEKGLMEVIKKVCVYCGSGSGAGGVYLKSARELGQEFLSREIKEVIRISKYDYHHIPVMNYIGKDPVKFGWGAYFGKSAYPGLFKKRSKKWGFQHVHPKISFNGRKGFTLKNRLTHFYCKDIEDMFDKLNSYSDARAKDIQNLNIDENLTMNIRRLFSRFWKCFFLRKGYREKKYGFVIAIIASIYPLISFLKNINEQKK